MSAAQPFVVMAKPVGSRCNMRCDYCYYLETDVGADGLHSMTEETLERCVRQYLEACPGPVASFTWHGGEPTLAGLPFYQRAVELQKTYLPDGMQCWNSLQTNGLLLDDQWCAFLAKEKFDVGLSIDGAAHLHDLYRKDAGGGGTYAKAAAAIRRLQAHGVQPDLLCTVTADTARQPQAVYRALRDFGTGWIQFIPIVRFHPDGTLTEDSVSGEQYGEFLCAVLDEWAYHDIGRLHVQLFAEMMLVLSGGEASLCWMQPACGRALVVERDGGVYSCDHYVDAAHRLGTLDSSLDALADSPSQRAFGQAKGEHLAQACHSCDVRSFCHGGCPKDRDEGGRNVLCDGLHRIFSYAKGPLESILGMQKRGMPAAAIMAELRRAALQAWKGVGRNDPCPCGSGKKAKQCCWARRP